MYLSSPSKPKNDTQDVSERNRALLEHMPLINKVAKWMHVKYGQYLDYDEIVNIGALGMMEALDTYDSSREIAFTTYCVYRIRGKILDYVRNQDWVPRGTRKIFKEYQETQDQLAMELNRKPRFNEIEQRLDMTERQSEVLKNNDCPVTRVSFESLSRNETAEKANFQFVDKKTPDPSVRIQGTDCKNYFMRDLDQVEKTIIDLYYYQKITMRKIGDSLGITESRVSQIHANIIDRFRARFNDNSETLRAVV